MIEYDDADGACCHQLADVVALATQKILIVLMEVDVALDKGTRFEAFVNDVKCNSNQKFAGGM